MGKKDTVTETGLVSAAQSIGRKMGSQLLEAAQEKNRVNLQELAICHVQAIQVQLKKQRDYRASTDANIALLEAKLKAIAEGDITLSPTGTIITFVDVTLGRRLIRMAECINCGAPNASR